MAEDVLAADAHLPYVNRPVRPNLDGGFGAQSAVLFWAFSPWAFFVARSLFRDIRREQFLADVGALPRVRDELEQFAIAATAIEGKDLRMIGWGSAAAALEIVRAGVRSSNG